MDDLLPIVAHPSFTRAVLRHSVARRQEIYIALRAIERGDEQLEHDQGDVYHFDLAWTPDHPLRLLLARGAKAGQEVALAVNAFSVQAGETTPARRLHAAQQAWEEWTP